VKIKPLLALFIIISNTLFNSVWASVHLVAGDHDTLESPHLHVVPDLKTLLDFGQDLDDSAQGEAEETHFHVLSDLATQYSGCDSSKTSLNIISAIPRYRTLTVSPPNPPPLHA
jgi:hypothetical protein